MSEHEKAITEVDIKIIETTPAVVNFNYQEISDHLDAVLSKYRGLVFTDSTIVECKKTIAELRKGQKALDEFRKLTKKQLTESVTAFENQCKTLYGKFDTVIQPLTQQYDQFELDRREKKRVEIQGVIDTLIAGLHLAEKYASQLLVPEEYFNKGKSIKDIKAELSALANTLKVHQDKEEQDIDLIKTKVELANAQYQLSNVLMPSSYLRLLSYKSVAEIDSLITADAKEISEREKHVAIEIPKAIEEIPAQPTKAPEVAPAPAPGADPVAESKLITAVYEITGTDTQLSALEAYLDASKLTWMDRV